MNCVIFGAGGWGTAMAIHLARQGQTVTLVPRRAEQALALATTRENKDYLPGHRLDDSILRRRLPPRRRLDSTCEERLAMKK